MNLKVKIERPDMPYCRICKQSSKVENKVIKARTLLDDFVLCLSCPSAAMLSSIKETGTTTLSANDALEKAKNIKADLARLNPNKKYRILIWGSAPNSTNPVTQKRHELKKELTEIGHQVFFSEDLVDSGNPINLQEALQTEIVDLVICIASDFGPVGEAHELLLGLGKQALVWFNERAEPAFTGQGIARILNFDGTKVEYYSDDFVRCCAIVKGSISFVDAMAALDNYADYLIRKASRIRVTRGRE